MKWRFIKIWLYGLFVLLCFSSCSSSSSDEPPQPYNGPWKIYYYEEYSGVHNDSQEFEAWFNEHLEYFYFARFCTKQGTYWEFDSSIEYPILQDYEDFNKGYISWYQVVEKAAEKEIQNMVNRFESFTIPENRECQFDKFSAIYKKLE